MTSTITISRHVPADPEHAFAAWVEPARLARWWWPQWPDTTYAVDGRVGGVVRIEAPEAGLGLTGTFLSYDPPRRFVMTWIWVSGGTPAEIDGDPVVDTVEVTFVPEAGGTTVTVAHTSTAHTPGGGAEQGWHDVLARLPGQFAN